MNNFTILSLSLSSVYCFSPLFTKSRVHLQQSRINYFYSDIIFNPQSLLLERSTFSHGLGSILLSDNTKKSISQTIEDMSDKVYNGDIADFQLNYNNGNDVYIIRDCTFIKLKKYSNILIELTGGITVYVTSCVFQSCLMYSNIFKLNAKACTFSHICCSDLQKTGDSNNNGLFLYSETQGNSFFKFVYSTIFGNPKEVNSKNILYFNGRCSIRYQCNNVSSFKLRYDNDGSITDQYTTLKLGSLDCVIMMMNTFSKLRGSRIVEINQQASDVAYIQYISLSNFIELDFKDACFILDMNQERELTIDNCVFEYIGDSSNPSYIMRTNDEDNLKGIIVINCVLNKEPNKLNIEYNDCTVMAQPKSHTLAHFTVKDVCDGDLVVDAHGCQNGTCPESMGCPPGAFDFKDDNKYTEKYHPDIDTPPPTPSGKFSESSKFTYSNYFSQSTGFTETDDFSKSSLFTKSGYFSSSRDFSPSTDFTKSSIFSYSGKFTKSSIFSDSDEINRTKPFSPSKYFSKTSEFTHSVDFSHSNYFSKTLDFTETNDFSKSNQFSESETLNKILTSTKSYSQSGVFTNSDIVSFNEKGGENQGSGGKLGTGPLSGIIIGAIAAAAIIAAIIIFFVIRKRKSLNIAEDADVMNGQESVVSVENALQDIMENDDPFAEEFK